MQARNQPTAFQRSAFALAAVLAACHAAPSASRDLGKSTISPIAALPGLEGTWYLNASGERASIEFGFDAATGQYTGSFVPEASGAASAALDSINWDSKTLTFRRPGTASYDWYRGTVVAGVMTGRLARAAAAALPADTSFATHFSAWTSAVDKDMVPRVFDLLVGDDSLVRLRLDRAANGTFLGRLKRYGSMQNGAASEDLEYDLDVASWDGAHLAFSAPGGSLQGSWTATVSGRLLSGTATIGGTTVPFTGARAEVLSHGLHDLGSAERAQWQLRARGALKHLMMADDPSPAPATLQILQSDVAPFAAQVPYDRDDDPQRWAQAYRLTELRIDFALPNPHGGAPMARRVHGWMSRPLAPPPAGGYPIVVALNGHSGSAHEVFDPGSELYFYGDSYARRGYVVLSIDISHRPVEDRSGSYGDWENGDDPDNGNGPHPAIKADGYDSDFEEDGERVWDVLHTVETVRNATPGLSPGQVLLTGLSMGGEITTFAGALDERFPMVVPGGFSPDFSVMEFHGNHPCWEWTHSELREYIDVSDLHALIAPRTLIVETGRADSIYSDFSQPFASDKQVLRRSRTAFADVSGNLTHYLHYDAHHYHFGDQNPSWQSELDVRYPSSSGPAQDGQTSWETDASTLSMTATLFDLAASSLLVRAAN
jgi:hypothetical protein